MWSWRNFLREYVYELRFVTKRAQKQHRTGIHTRFRTSGPGFNLWCNSSHYHGLANCFANYSISDKKLASTIHINGGGQGG